MEVELQELRNQIAQLKADNEQLRQERTPAATSSGAGTSAGPASPAAPVDRLVFIPRDRKCPMFRGRTGISVGEWAEEVQACMRARHLLPADQAFFLFDHLEGEAKEEAFFSRRQQEGETLQEFSLALLNLMEKVKLQAPGDMPNAEMLLRDQFIEQVCDGSLRRELKQYVRRCPRATLLEARGEAIRWELEGLPAGVRGRSNSVPSAFGLQYAMRGSPGTEVTPTGTEVSELKELLKKQQEQLDLLTQNIALLQTAQSVRQRSRSPRYGPIVCNRCQQPGHIARDCDGPHVPSRQQPSLPTQRRFNQPSEN